MASGKKKVVADEQILAAIELFTYHNGYPPSYREVAGMVGFKSQAAVATRIDELESKGFVVRRKNKPRTLRVVQDYNSTRTSVRGE